SNAPCGNSSDDVVISFPANPTVAVAGPDQTGAALCGVTSTTLGANAPVVGTGAWSIVSGAGGTIVTVNSPTSSFSGVAGSSYTALPIFSNAPCGNSSDDVVISFPA